MTSWGEYPRNIGTINNIGNYIGTIGSAGGSGSGGGSTAPDVGGGGSGSGTTPTGTDLFTVMNTTYIDTTKNGITYTWNEGVCTVSGTASGQSFNNMIVMEPLEEPLVPGNEYYLELNNTDSNIKIQVFQTIGGTSTSKTYNTNSYFTIDPTTTRTVIRVFVPDGITVNGTINPKLYTVDASTRDLFSSMDTTRIDKTSNGIAYTWNGDTCTVSGTSTGLSFNNLVVMEPLTTPLIPGNTYRFELDSTDPTNIYIAVYQTIDGVSQSTTIKQSGTFTYNAAVTRTVIRLQVNSGVSVNGTIRVKMFNA